MCGRRTWLVSATSSPRGGGGTLCRRRVVHAKQRGHRLHDVLLVCLTTCGVLSAQCVFFGACAEQLVVHHMRIAPACRMRAGVRVGSRVLDVSISLSLSHTHNDARQPARVARLGVAVGLCAGACVFQICFRAHIKYLIRYPIGNRIFNKRVFLIVAHTRTKISTRVWW